MRQFLEYAKMAMKNIWANKVRTLLTMLGIIIGISSVILIISVGSGAMGVVTNELGELGKGQIQFMQLSNDAEYCVTQDDLDEIRKIDGVKEVAYQNFFEGTISTKKDDFKAEVVAINETGFVFLESEFVTGGAYTKEEADAGKPVCVIREDHAMDMFGTTDVVGMEFVVRLYDSMEIPLEIKGVTKSEEENMLVEFATEETTPTVQIIIPPMTITRTVGLDLSKEIYSFFVLKEDSADAKKLCDEVIYYLETTHHCEGENVYMYQSFDDIMKTVNSVVNLITVIMAFIASISLLVGGVGVMNIMLVSVTERTREIGIRKALGAKTRSITAQFLAESAFITLIGGVIGILVGVGGAWCIAGIVGALVPNMEFVPSLSFGTIFIASAFSSCVGLFFGIYPARKAAKLSPIEALRQN